MGNFYVSGIRNDSFIDMWVIHGLLFRIEAGQIGMMSF